MRGAKQGKKGNKREEIATKQPRAGIQNKTIPMIRIASITLVLVWGIHRTFDFEFNFSLFPKNLVSGRTASIS